MRSGYRPRVGELVGRVHGSLLGTGGADTGVARSITAEYDRYV